MCSGIGNIVCSDIENIRKTLRVTLIVLAIFVAILIFFARPRECFIPAEKVAFYLRADTLATQIWQKCQELSFLHDPKVAKCGELLINTAKIAENARFLVEEELKRCEKAKAGERNDL